MLFDGDDGNKGWTKTSNVHEVRNEWKVKKYPQVTRDNYFLARHPA